MNKTSKKTQYKGVVSAFLLLLLALIASVSALFAWFSDRSRAALGGTELSVIGADVTLGEITLTRTLGGHSQTQHYFRDGNGYYLGENGAIVTVDGAKIPLALDAVAQNEEISLVIKVKAENGLSAYSVDLSGLSGDMLTQESGTVRSVLGAFRYYNKERGDWAWFAEYKTDGTEKIPNRIRVLSGAFSGEEQDEKGFVSLQIRLRADFSQAAEYGFTAQSFAGKGIRIGAITVSAE